MEESSFLKIYAMVVVVWVCLSTWFFFCRRARTSLCRCCGPRNYPAGRGLTVRETIAKVRSVVAGWFSCFRIERELDIELGPIELTGTVFHGTGAYTLGPRRGAFLRPEFLGNVTQSAENLVGPPVEPLFVVGEDSDWETESEGEEQTELIDVLPTRGVVGLGISGLDGLRSPAVGSSTSFEDIEIDEFPTPVMELHADDFAPAGFPFGSPVLSTSSRSRGSPRASSVSSVTLRPDSSAENPFGDVASDLKASSVSTVKLGLAAGRFVPAPGSDSSSHSRRVRLSRPAVRTTMQLRRAMEIVDGLEELAAQAYALYMSDVAPVTAARALELQQDVIVFAEVGIDRFLEYERGSGVPRDADLDRIVEKAENFWMRFEALSEPAPAE